MRQQVRHGEEQHQESGGHRGREAYRKNIQLRRGARHDTEGNIDQGDDHDGGQCNQHPAHEDAGAPQDNTHQVFRGQTYRPNRHTGKAVRQDLDQDQVAIQRQE